MPGKVKVRILAGRNLPVMDKSSDTSDAFVEVKLGNTTYKTEVFRHSLNPYWNSEWFRFEADDEELQDEPLQIRIMDYDTYSANDAIGKVYIDLNPLLHKDSGHIMFGWFPIYDTMHGIRGEVHLAVKVDLFSDSNRYRQSSCGVRFFYSPGIPHGYSCQAILGFVEELVVNDDPEYQWIDKIRTPRASNEARQTLFSKLSGEVKRKIGLKALDLGGNSVIGYRQCFDLEGESGIVVRGIGTAVTLVKSDLTSYSRRHHNYGSTPTGVSTLGKEDCLCERNCESLFSSLPLYCFGMCLCFGSHWLTRMRNSHCDSLSQCCLSSFSDGSCSDRLSPYSSLYWLCNQISSPGSSPPIPRVAFLSYCDLNIPYFHSYSRTSSPSPSMRSSPVPFASSAPKISQWLNKLTKNVASPLIAKRSVSHTSTLPRTRSLKVKIGVSLDAETATVSKTASLKFKEQLLVCKSALKRVASQPVSSLSRHNSVNSSFSVQHKVASSNESSNSATLQTTCDPLSIARFPTTNSNEDQSNNFTLPTACKGISLLSSSPPDPIASPITPLTAPAGVYPVSPLGASKILTTSPKSSNMHRRGSSDPDLSTTPNCGSNQSSGSGSAGNKSFKFLISPEGIHLLEYPFITMKQLPVGLVQHIGGVVSSRSVKILDQINNPDDPETRDAWWMELRKEVRSHCRALGCNAVLGYSESTNICDEVVILSASGTAAILSTEKDKRDFDQNTPPTKLVSKMEYSYRNHIFCDNHHQTINCSLCHIPYTEKTTESTVPFPSSLTKCNICKKGKVPDVLFMTVEPPADIPITGIGCLIQARVCRYKRDSKGEQCAKEISDSLPFLEYELHRQLLSKLKVKGMNGLFGLTVQISVGDNLLIALATGTGAFISALQAPQPPQISSGKGVQTSKLNEIQKLIFESVSKNREHYGLTQSSNVQTIIEVTSGEKNVNVRNKDMNSNENIHQSKVSLKIADPEIPVVEKTEDLDPVSKGQVLLEVDDTEDADIISLMIDSDIPEGYEVCNTEIMPGLGHHYVCNLQTFSQVYRSKLNSSKQFGQQFDWILQSLFVKLRRLVPCCLTDLKFTVDLPETDLVQLTVMGSVVGLGSLPHVTGSGKSSLALPSHYGSSFRKRTMSASDPNEDLVFSMDEDSRNDSVDAKENTFFHSPPTEHSGIELTPLSFIPDGRIHYYLGNLDFFFIRESTSIRESGGLNGFMHSFLSEVFAIVRAHVASLGGNAMTALHLTQCVLLYNPHKNQSQCLINIAGDAVQVHYHNSKPNANISKIHAEMNANDAAVINEECETLSHL